MELFELPTAILSQKGRTDLAWLYFTITSMPHKKRVWFILISFSTLNWVFYMSRNWQKSLSLHRGEKSNSTCMWKSVGFKFTSLYLSVQKLGECSPASTPLCPVIFYLVEIIYDNEKIATIGTGNAYPLIGFLSLHRPQETLMVQFCSQKHWQSSKSLISKLWICKPFVVHDTTVHGARHKPMWNGDLWDHGIVERMMWLLG